MVVDRSGIHQAPQLDTTRNHSPGTLRRHGFPAHGGPPLHPIDGFWRVMEDAMGAGRGFHERVQRYKRPRQVLLAHHERPMYALHW